MEFFVIVKVHNLLLSVRNFFTYLFGNHSTGHIAHLNLREDLLTYKKIIAEVILDVSFSTCFRSCYIVILGNIVLKDYSFLKLLGCLNHIRAVSRDINDQFLIGDVYRRTQS